MEEEVGDRGQIIKARVCHTKTYVKWITVQRLGYVVESPAEL